ncbi:MAG: hypothetical protein ACK6DO_06205, partial [Planctomycetia bacterium]
RERARAASPPTMRPPARRPPRRRTAARQTGATGEVGDGGAVGARCGNSPPRRGCVGAEPGGAGGGTFCARAAPANPATTIAARRIRRWIIVASFADG